MSSQGLSDCLGYTDAGLLREKSEARRTGRKGSKSRGRRHRDGAISFARPFEGEQVVHLFRLLQEATYFLPLH